MGSLVTALWIGMLVVGSVSPTLANHTIFAYGVDRVELDGSAAGPYDGQPDLADDFDWTVPSESPFAWKRPFNAEIPVPSPQDGIYFLASPGMHIEGPEGQPLDVSVITGGSAIVDGRKIFMIEKPAGDFDVTAYWQPVPPAPGHHFQMSLFTPGATEIVGVGLQNLDGGLAIEQHRVEASLFATQLRNLVHHFEPVSPDSVRQRIVLRLSFHRETSTLTSAVSLDGGDTWHRPFAALPFFAASSTNAVIALSADPASRPPSTTTTTTTSTTLRTTTLDPCASVCPLSVGGRGALKLDDRRGSDRDFIRLKWWSTEPVTREAVGDPLGTTTYDFCITDAMGKKISAATLMVGGECFGNACWRRVGASAYLYRDVNGLRAGIFRASVRRGHGGKVSMTVVGRGWQLNMPALPVAPPVTVHLRASTGACWGGVLRSDDIRANTTSRFRAAARTAR